MKNKIKSKIFGGVGIGRGDAQECRVNEIRVVTVRDHLEGIF